MDFLWNSYPRRSAKAKRAAIETFVAARVSEGDRIAAYGLLRRFAAEANFTDVCARVSEILGEPATPSRRACSACGRDVRCKLCEGCAVFRSPAAYCGRPCQKLHWAAAHKAECSANAAPLTDVDVTVFVAKVVHHADLAESLVDVARVAAQLFRCVCVYVRREGAHMRVRPFFPAADIHTDDVSSFLRAMTGSMTAAVRNDDDAVLVVHLEIFQMYLDGWRRGAEQFGFVGRPHAV